MKWFVYVVGNLVSYKRYIIIYNKKCIRSM